MLLHGPSGCGKTTLLSAIAGLLTPESGSIRFDGEDVAGLGGRAMLRHRRDRVGMVFQSFNLIPSLTAVENVAVPLTVAGVSTRKARARATRAAHRARSGAIASITVPAPCRAASSSGWRSPVRWPTTRRSLLADEPTAHLDHTQIESVRSTLRAIADAGRIVIISTHDDRLGEVADRVVQMSGSNVGRAVSQRNGLRAAGTASSSTFDRRRRSGYVRRMTHVLIAVDDTEGSVVAAKTAYRLFGDAADYTVINVAEPVPCTGVTTRSAAAWCIHSPCPAAGDGGGMPLTVTAPDTSNRVAEPVDLAEQTAQQVVAEAGVHDANPIGDTGDPAEAIIAAAHEYDADVIVVGTHDHGWFARLFTSSVADESCARRTLRC